MVSSHTPHALDPKLVSWVAGSPRTTEPRADVARDTLVRASRVWAGVPVELALASELPHEVATETRAAVLSWVGSSPIARRPSVAIVGTRRLHGVSGTSVAEFLHELVPSVGLPVVSGGALGVDTVAHRAALEAGLPVTVVIAGGLCHPSPASNRADFRRVVAAGGTVVSDRPPAMPPARHDFVRRNRLIAALADVVVVAAAPEASGALATARYAAQLGRVVLAVPGAPRDPLFAGNHQLLRQGARICCCAEDVVSALGGALVAGGVLRRELPARAASPSQGAPETAIPDTARRVLELLQANGHDVDAVIRASGLSAGDVQASVLELELAGAI
ncbi:MAG: DNA-processing protein DprA [Myxococcales bacterium]|nr:DNA-processing protein DprA [Myxococcales bacterium]MCB9531069.1 DNA-processing protein DprA [Myxococcales bacterium]MCB9532979.1 DNA-processing protein DprA [Myxococcales bacterium]